MSWNHKRFPFTKLRHAAQLGMAPTLRQDGKAEGFENADSLIARKPLGLRQG